MSKTYQIVTKAAKESAAIIEQFRQANGQILLALLNLMESAGQVVETVIHEIGIQTLELILRINAEQVGDPRTPGKASGEIRWYGSQPGKVKLADRQVKVKRLRLWHKTEGETKGARLRTLLYFFLACLAPQRFDFLGHGVLQLFDSLAGYR